MSDAPHIGPMGARFVMHQMLSKALDRYVVPVSQADVEYLQRSTSEADSAERIARLANHYATILDLNGRSDDWLDNFAKQAMADAERLLGKPIDWLCVE
jgi:hypothetical protein